MANKGVFIQSGPLSFSSPYQTLHAIDKNHGSYMFKGLLAMYKDGKYSDVSLRIGHERTLRAHRNVLASFSPYFEALLGANWEEEKKGEIGILGFDETAVSDLIEFAYSGKIDINKDNVQALLEAANYLGVEFVEKSCGDFLKSVVDDKTCPGLWHLADVFALEELKNVVKQYALRHFADVCKEEEFFCLPLNLLTELLANEGLCVVIEDLVQCEEEREKIVLQAVFQYIQHDLESRRELLPELLPLVKLPTLSEEYLKEVATNKLVADSCTCKEILAKAQTLKVDWTILKENAIWEGGQIDPPDKWVMPRDFAKYVVTWGRSFANGGHLPDHSHYTDVYTFEDLENNCYVNGMGLWFRYWYGKLVLGGLKIFYNEDNPMTFGFTSDEAPEHHEFHLEENEKIVSVEVSSSWMIDRLTFYSNKKDDDGYQKSYGPYGGDGGAFNVEHPAGSFGYLTGVAGAVANRNLGKPGVIIRLQFAWRSYVFPGVPMPEKYWCCIGEDVREDDYDFEDESLWDDEFDDDDDFTIFDFFDGFEDDN